MPADTRAAPFEQRLDPAVFHRIRERVQTALASEGLSAILTDDPEDVAYLTGFFHHPGERPVAVLLRDDGRILLLVPELERQHAEEQHAQAEIVTFAEYPGLESPFAPLARAVGPLRGRVGVTTLVTHHRLDLASAAFDDVEWAPTELVTRARAIKLPEEIVLHREAARITDRMLEAGVALVADAVAAGGRLPSEQELAGHVGSVGIGTMYAEHRDVVVVSFLAGGLVYAGANSAIPHGLPSSYRLSPGDTFMLSLGCAVGGRFVEGERTFVLGEPSDEQRRYHETVRLAQAEGSRAIAPGVRCADSNARCLDVIRDAGLGRYLRHRQGHGIGLGMHEPPWLEDGDRTLLEPGMIVSNEPGLYVPGHAGYRISDSMLVTEDGSEPLTVFPRDLASCTIPV
ncbi:Xaa-Pro aminopeptidase [Labedella gwakjiensis]|uniref:Aminopeptidase P family protein n=1 Tax=Labedella gwakjiensis TaxID=390269 RepID=A0A2P8GTB0_9MICO|nr:Xaa-Pro peptidase family protein [Labedella gwakjiensis]PSL37185.1 Xaa-Pro aminopeptidase [Labedella gwakjiensis]RUQ81919.1 aminopeptidase P family protein [Labedella gwakjiensis]